MRHLLLVSLLSPLGAQLSRIERAQDDTTVRSSCRIPLALELRAAP